MNHPPTVSSTSTTHSILILRTLAGDKNKISIKRVRKKKWMRRTQRTRLICLCLGHYGIITENLTVRAGCTWGLSTFLPQNKKKGLKWLSKKEANTRLSMNLEVPIRSNNPPSTIMIVGLLIFFWITNTRWIVLLCYCVCSSISNGCTKLKIGFVFTLLVKLTYVCTNSWHGKVNIWCSSLRVPVGIQ